MLAQYCAGSPLADLAPFLLRALLRGRAGLLRLWAPRYGLVPSDSPPRRRTVSRCHGPRTDCESAWAAWIPWTGPRFSPGWNGVHAFELPLFACTIVSAMGKATSSSPRIPGHSSCLLPASPKGILNHPGIAGRLTVRIRREVGAHVRGRVGLSPSSRRGPGEEPPLPPALESKDIKMP